MRNQKGISMLTVVITVVVMLILASVTFVSSFKTIEETGYSKYVTNVSEVSMAFEQTSVIVKGQKIKDKKKKEMEQIHNYVAKNGDEEKDFLKLEDVPKYTIIKDEGQIGIPLPEIIVESGTAKKVPVKYATTEKGTIFTWPPLDYDGKLWITDTDTVEDKMQTQIKIDDEIFEIRIDSADGSLLDWPENSSEEDPDDDETPSEHEHVFYSKVQTDDYFCSDATCDKPKQYYYKCIGCNEKGSQTYDVGTPLGHLYGAAKVTKEPNCTEKGISQSECSRCNNVKNEDIPINPENHHGNRDEAVTKEPTCLEEGSKTYKCSSCKFVLGTESIPMTEHNMDKVVTTKEANCTEKGLKTYNCSTCDKEMKTEEIDALGHDWSAPEAPRKCNRCGLEEIPTNITYKVEYISTSGANLGTETVEKAYGTTNTITAPAKTGYETPASQTIVWDSIEERTITFKYKPVEYNVTFTLNGGTGVTNRTYTIETTTFTLGTPSKTGHTFIGWTGDNGTTAQKTVSIAKGSTGNKSYTANWSTNSYTYDIVYKSKSGVALGSATATKEYGTTNTIIAPEKTGYKTPASQDVAWDSVSAKTITFEYEPIEYNVTFSLNGGTGVSDTTYTIETEDFTLGTPEREGYTFTGWIGDNILTPQKTVTIVKGSIGDRNYEANWEANNVTYNVVYKSTTGIELGTATVEKAFGTTNEITAPEMTGYTTPASQTVAWDSTEAKTIEFVYEPIEYNVVITLNGGTGVSNTTYTIETEDFTLGTPEREGYTFTGWTGDNGLTPQKTVSIVKGSIGDRNYEANWEANNVTYNVVYKSTTGIELGTATVEKAFGTTNTIVAPEKTGYQTPASQDVVWDSVSAKTITFEYEPIEYNVELTLNGGTGVSNTTYTIETEDFTLGTPEREGYTFAGWTGSNGEAPETIVTIAKGTTGDKNYEANWNTITYEITIDCNGGTGVTDTTYTVETEDFTLGTPEREGYTFTGWTGSNGEDPETTVTIVKGSTGDKNYKANWTVNSYTYNVVYKSTTGIDLGSATVTNNFGTTNTIVAPEKEGYTTPASQEIVWDSTTAKTITFEYEPIVYNVELTLNSGTLDSIVSQVQVGDYVNYSANGIDSWRVFDILDGEVLLTPADGVVGSLELGNVDGYINAASEIEEMCDVYTNNALGITEDDVRSMTLEDINRVTGYTPEESTTKYAYFLENDGTYENSIVMDGYIKTKATINSYSTWTTPRFYAWDYAENIEKDENGINYAYPTEGKPVYITETYYHYVPNSYNHVSNNLVTVGNLLSGNYGWLSSTSVGTDESHAYFAVYHVRSGGIGANGMVGSNGDIAKTTIGVRPLVTLNSNIKATRADANTPWELSLDITETVNIAYTIETETFTLGTPAKTGYTFTGWTGDNGTTPETTINIAKGSTGDKNYETNWSIETYDITIDCNGGTGVDNTTYTVETETFTLGTPTRKGYEFAGWTVSERSTPELLVTIEKGSTGDREYKANWKLVKYTITHQLNGGILDLSESIITKAQVGDYVNYSANGVTSWRVFDIRDNEVLITPASGPVGSLDIRGAKGFSTALTEIEKKCDEYVNSSLGITANNVRSMTAEDINKVTGYSPVASTTKYAYFLSNDSKYSSTEVKEGYTKTKHTSSLSGISTPRFYMWDYAENVTTDSNGYSYAYPTSGKPVYVTKTYYSYNPSSYNHLGNNSIKVGSLLGSSFGWLAEYCVSMDSTLAVSNMRLASSNYVDAENIIASNGVSDSEGPYGVRPLVSLGANIKATRASDSAAWELSLDNTETANITYTIETETFTLGTPVKTGYTFEGWTGDNGAIAQTTVTINKGTTGNKNYEANWVVNGYTYNVVYKSTTGTDLGTATVTKSFGTTNTINAPEKTGYKTPASQDVAWDSTTAKTITFEYEPIEYNVELTLNGGTGVEDTTYTIETETFELGAPIRTGYTFTGWTGDNGTTPQTTVTIEKGTIGDKTYTANWSTVNYDITIDCNGGTGVYNTTYTVETEDITLGIPIRMGYEFTGWTGSNGETPEKTITIAKGSTGNKEYKANWKLVDYTITYELNDGTVATANPTTYNVETETFTLNNPSKVGYTFAGWTGSNNTTPETSVSISKGSTGNKNYTANWTVNGYEYNVVYKSTSGLDLGTTTVSKEYGTTNEITAPEKEGYKTPASQTVAWDSVDAKTITFTYEPMKYSITIGLNGGTGVSSTSYTIETETFELGTPEREGYTFTGWTGDNGSNPEITVTIEKGSTGARNYFANWEANGVTYNVVYKSTSGADLGTATVEKAFGTTNTIAAPEKEGYTTPASQDVVWDSTTAKTITFEYAPIEYNVELTLNGGSLDSIVSKAQVGDYVNYSANGIDSWRVFDIRDGEVLITPAYGPTTETLTLSGTDNYANAIDLIEDKCDDYTNSTLEITEADVRSMTVEDINRVAGYILEESTTRYAYYLNGDTTYTSGTLTYNGNDYTKIQHTATLSNDWTTPRFYEWDYAANVSGDENGNIYAYPTVGNPVYITKTAYTYTTNLSSHIGNSNIKVGDLLGNGYGWLASQCVDTKSTYTFFGVFITYSGDISYRSVANSDGYTGSHSCGVRPLVSLGSDIRATRASETAPWDLTVDNTEVVNIPYTIETETFELGTPVKTGYTFEGWTEDNGTTQTIVTINKGTTGNKNYAANWDVNEYTYNVVYKSVTGTDLGSTTVKNNFGTTNTIVAPEKEGYTTPASQDVVWDSAEAKTITFEYEPIEYNVALTLNGGTLDSVVSKAQVGDYVNYSANGIDSWRVFDIRDGEVLITPADGETTKTLTLSNVDGYVNAVSKIEEVCDEYTSSSLGITARNIRSMTVEDINKATGYTPEASTTKYAYFLNSDTKYDSTTLQDSTYTKTKLTPLLLQNWTTPRFYTWDNVGNPAIAYDEVNKAYYAYPTEGRPVYATQTYYSYNPSSYNHVRNSSVTVGSLLGSDWCWLASTCVDPLSNNEDFHVRRVYSNSISADIPADSCGYSDSPSYGVRPLVSLSSRIQATRTDESSPWELSIDNDSILLKAKVGDYVNYSANGIDSWRVFDIRDGEVLITPADGETTETLTLSGVDGYVNAVSKLDEACDAYTNSSLGITASNIRNMTVEDINKATGYTPKASTTKYAYFLNSDTKYDSTTLQDSTYTKTKLTSILLQNWSTPRFYTWDNVGNPAIAYDEVNKAYYAYPTEGRPVYATQTYYSYDPSSYNHVRNNSVTVGSLLRSDWCWLASTCVDPLSNNEDFHVRRVCSNDIDAHIPADSCGYSDSPSYGVCPLVSLEASIKATRTSDSLPWELSLDNTENTTYTIETETFELGTPAKTGYDFAGWTGSNNSTPEKTVSIEKGSTGDKNYEANWVVNGYEYNVVYKSTSGKELGTTTVSKEYGTTNEITAPEKTGYKTPASQTIAWDSTTAKTITFEYEPIEYNIELTLNGGSLDSIVGKAQVGDYVNYSANGIDTWRVFDIRDGEVLITPAQGATTETLTLSGIDGYVNGISDIEKECDTYANSSLGITESKVRSMTVEDINRVAGYTPTVNTTKYAYFLSSDSTYDNTMLVDNTYIKTKNASLLEPNWTTPRFYTWDNVGNPATAYDEVNKAYYAYPTVGKPVYVTQTYYVQSLNDMEHVNNSNVKVGDLLGDSKGWLASLCVLTDSESARFNMSYAYSSSLSAYALVGARGATYSPSLGVRPLVSLSSNIKATRVNESVAWDLTVDNTEVVNIPYTIETETFELGTPVKTGYDFAGWTGSNNSTPETTVSIEKGSTGDKNYEANWVVNGYEYNVVYKSTSGVDLGTTTVTKSFGTTNTIVAPEKTGYTTPASQEIVWDSTEAKTITFEYEPIEYNVELTLNEGSLDSIVSKAQVGDYVNYSANGITSWRVFDIVDGEVLITPAQGATTETLTLSGIDGYVNAVSEIENACDAYTNSSLGITESNVRSMTLDDINRVTGYTPELGIAKYAYFLENDSTYDTATVTNGYTKVKHTSSLANGWTVPRFYTWDYAYPENITRDSNGNNYAFPTNGKPVYVTYGSRGYDPSSYNHVGNSSITVGSLLGSDYGWLASQCVKLESSYAIFCVHCVKSNYATIHYLVGSEGSSYSPSCGVRPLVSLGSNIKATRASETAAWDLAVDNTEVVNIPYTVETETFTLKTPLRTSYTFKGWTESNNTIPETSVSITKGSAGNKSYTANWTAISYSITINCNGGSGVSSTSYTIETETFTLGTPIRTGYTFAGWTDSSGAIHDSVTITKGSKGSKNYTANWIANEYEYNVVYQSTSEVSLGSTTVTKAFGTTNIIAPPERTGYNTPASQEVAWDSTTAKTITFIYEPTSYSVTINPNGGSGVSSMSYTIESETFTLGTPTRTGYTFTGWTDSNGTTQTSVTIPKGSMGARNYTANWTIDTYTISYNSGFDLPAGYKILSYIQSSGTQYINTGVTWNTNDLSVQGIYEYTSLSGHASILGTQDSSNGSNFILREESGTLTWWMSNNRTSITTVAPGQKINFNLRLASGTYSYNVQIGSNTPVTGSGTHGNIYDSNHIYLFDTQRLGGLGSTAASTIKCNAKLYSLKITKNGTLLRDFIPCISPDGVIGLYDVVGGKFYTNKGTGTFTASESYPTTYNVNSTVTLPTPSRPNATFIGWYEDASFTGNKVEQITAGNVGNKTYIANWSIQNTYTAIINPNGGYRVSDSNYNALSFEYEYGAIRDISERKRAGYTLIGYVITNTETGSTTDIGGATITFNSSTKTAVFTQGSRNVTITAQWAHTVIQNHWYLDGNSTWQHLGTTYDTVGHNAVFVPYGLTAPSGYTVKSFDFYDEASTTLLGEGTMGVDSISVNQNCIVNVRYFPTQLYLYHYGNTYSATTGGWVQATTSSSDRLCNMSLNSDHIAITGRTNLYDGCCGTAAPIDLSKYTKLCALAYTSDTAGHSGMFVTSSLSGIDTYMQKAILLPTSPQVITLDISNINSGYIAFTAYSGVASQTTVIHSVWLE